MSFTINSSVYNLEATLTSGQMFRAHRQPDGSYIVLSRDQYCKAWRDKETSLIRVECDDDFDSYWKHYFNIFTDFERIESIVGESPLLRKIYEYSKGIVILQQDPWECLISFIISQHNNIRRITECMERICELNGRILACGYFAFPTAKDMADLPLSGLGLGYRDQYIRDAVARANMGVLDLDSYTADKVDYQTARLFLLSLYGIGPKVADCVALYGLGHSKAFPIDVHIQRVLGLPEMQGFNWRDLSDLSGLFQLYLFNYAINNGL